MHTETAYPNKRQYPKKSKAKKGLQHFVDKFLRPLGALPVSMQCSYSSYGAERGL